MSSAFVVSEGLPVAREFRVQGAQALDAVTPEEGRDDLFCTFQIRGDGVIWFVRIGLDVTGESAYLLFELADFGGPNPVLEVPEPAQVGRDFFLLGNDDRAPTQGVPDAKLVEHVGVAVRDVRQDDRASDELLDDAFEQ